MSDFGYADDGAPVVRNNDASGMWWRDGWAVAHMDAYVTPVQVVAPGQVAVDAADLLVYLATTAHLAFDVETSRVRNNLRAALAATDPAPGSKRQPCGKCKHWRDAHHHGGAIRCEGNAHTCRCDGWEPAPDTEQGETWVPPVDMPAYSGGEQLGSKVPAASGGGTEADGDEGEPCGGCGHPRDEHTGVDRIHCQKGVGYCPCEGWTPAAEPDRVTLPDTRERLKQHMLKHFHSDQYGQWRLNPHAAADDILAEVRSALYAEGGYWRKEGKDDLGSALIDIGHRLKDALREAGGDGR